MNRQLLSSSVALLLLALPLVGCSSSGGDESADADNAAVSAAASACGQAKFNEGLAFYKKAVQGANTRHSKPDDVCGGEDGTFLIDIVSNGEKAITSCGDFKNIIKTSPYANNVRDQLKGTLSLAILTGDLDPSTWRQLAASLPGVSVHGGNGIADSWNIDFKEAGAATISVFSYDGNGDPANHENAAKWAVEQQDGKAVIKLTATGQNGSDVSYTFAPTRIEEQGVISYSLQLQGEVNPAFDMRSSFYDAADLCD